MMSGTGGKDCQLWKSLYFTVILFKGVLSNTFIITPLLELVLLTTVKNSIKRYGQTLGVIKSLRAFSKTQTCILTT